MVLGSYPTSAPTLVSFFPSPALLFRKCFIINFLLVITYKLFVSYLFAKIVFRGIIKVELGGVLMGLNVPQGVNKGK